MWTLPPLLTCLPLSLSLRSLNLHQHLSLALCALLPMASPFPLIFLFLHLGIFIVRPFSIRLSLSSPSPFSSSHLLFTHHHGLLPRSHHYFKRISIGGPRSMHHGRIPEPATSTTTRMVYTMRMIHEQAMEMQAVECRVTKIKTKMDRLGLYPHVLVLLLHPSHTDQLSLPLINTAQARHGG